MSEAAPRRDPFGPVASAAVYVPRPATDEAFSRLERAVLREGRVAVLRGPAGLGKTLLLRRLAERARKDFDPVYFPYAALDVGELCRWTLSALGAGPVDDSPGVFRAWIAHQESENSGVLLLIDDATALPLETAAWLAKLASESKGGLRIALAALDGKASEPLMRAFDDAEEIHLGEPMSASETRAYLAARLAMAELSPERRAAFSAAVVERLHRVSRGNPRRLHSAADLVLRGVAPESIAAFLDGASPDEEAREEGARRIAAIAAAAARRASEAAERGFDPDETQPDLGPSPEEPVRPEPPAPVARSEPEPSVAPEPAPEPEPQGEEPTPGAASRALRQALGDDGAVLRDLGIEGQAEEPEPAPPPSSDDTAIITTPPRPRPAPAAVRPDAGELLREATAAVREATRALRAPGTGEVESDLLDAIGALRGAIAAAQEASAGAAEDEEAPSEARAGRSRIAALARAAVVVSVLALGAAAAVVYFPGLLESMRAIVERSAPTEPPAPRPPLPRERVPIAEPQIIREPAPSASEPEPVVEARPAPEPALPPKPVVEARPAPEPTPPPKPVVKARPKPPPAPKPAAPVPVFRVGINATPWATIEVDGKQVGETPIAGISLPRGVHTFRARMPDGRILERRVEIDADTRSVVFP